MPIVLPILDEQKYDELIERIERKIKRLKRKIPKSPRRGMNHNYLYAIRIAIKELKSLIKNNNQKDSEQEELKFGSAKTFLFSSSEKSMTKNSIKMEKRIMQKFNDKMETKKWQLIDDHRKKLILMRKIAVKETVKYIEECLEEANLLHIDNLLVKNSKFFQAFLYKFKQLKGVI